LYAKASAIAIMVFGEGLFVIKFRPAKNLAPFGPLERSHHAASCHT
jgi:hypothetical protein